jgi:hypothetical protein
MAVVTVTMTGFWGLRELARTFRVSLPRLS